MTRLMGAVAVPKDDVDWVSCAALRIRYCHGIVYDVDTNASGVMVSNVNTVFAFC